MNVYHIIYSIQTGGSAHADLELNVAMATIFLADVEFLYFLLTKIKFNAAIFYIWGLLSTVLLFLSTF